MIRYITGYIRVSVSGNYLNAFMNKCRKYGIELRNVRYKDKKLNFEIKNPDAVKCRKLASEHNLCFNVNKHYGFVALLRAYKKRWIFMVFVFVCTALFILNSMYITNITVNGNVNLTKSQIINVLARSGIEPGTFKFGINQRDVQKKMIENCDQLSWVWVVIKGTNAIVDVREKVPIPEFYDRGFACNVVAGRDGVITKAISSNGILYAQTGNYVKKGDLLIGGVYDSNDYAPTRYVHAAGEIYARTMYTAEGDFGDEYTKYSLSDKINTSYGIKFGNLAINKNISSLDVLLSNTKVKKFKIFGKIYLPLAFTKREYCEIIYTKNKMNGDKIQEYALDELSTRLHMSIPDNAKVINTKKEITPNKNGTVHIKLTFECEEDIGTESPIEFTY